MNLLFWIIAFTLIGGILSVIAASLFLLIPDHHRSRILPHGISFALGALLAVAFLDLLPHAVEAVGAERSETVFAAVLLGILALFLLEKLLLWRHCHAGDCETHTDEHFHQPAGTLIVLGDGIHNFVDGVLIASAFLTDVHLGIVTSLAVFAHEIPQEVGDFAILLKSGYSRPTALLYNLLSSLATLLGGVLAYYSLENLREALPYFLALAASSFVYVAVADLIPSLHERTNASAALQQIAMIGAGVLLIFSAHAYSEEFHKDHSLGAASSKCPAYVL
ncbi:ZIP family metal transporter [Methylocaldum szegediense]|jgi:zinc and cadmium transporter|uniref:Zinc and cadmium transporter n=1 Tax=Methylocaldum szegediense TaxID=73780 RepID=A0ABM9I3F3_9GAMM|nr:ZIP family metal transporter [Methylocaldum szegediense]CAI8864608.1 zinc and cadmium transporter [Methylocaldum szegediense]